ncbi:MAG: uracil-DNA glycosylase [Proteobacteria bacterium]|nr:uracil-DNA glycosylase [Pseudomonadota bacterium]MBQ4359052.1 uracil-DNA glycosylase [Pseudomonadota bacterium]
MAKEILHNDWAPLLAPAFATESYQKLRQFLIHEYRTQKIHPGMYDIFNALHLTAYSDVKVVLLGQDPYHGDNQAHGLSFSVLRPTPPPPSLVNIYRELKSDLGIDPPSHGDLTSWARQGVLLLNTVLTVRHGQANSHRGQGWEDFTDQVIRLVNDKTDPVVFVLWGRNAQAKIPLITNPVHLILKAPHPSPLSASYGFFGSRPFSQINAFLEAHGRSQIDWHIPEEPMVTP